jgi:hypothetical protein
MSLAIEVALADVDDAQVLVFDEVDAGIGGATAMAVGEKLARLAAGAGGGVARQVLCVTHLAQLAAFADVHHVVEKGLAGAGPSPRPGTSPTRTASRSSPGCSAGTRRRRRDRARPGAAARGPRAATNPRAGRGVSDRVG